MTSTDSKSILSFGSTEPASGSEFYGIATAYTAYCQGCSGTLLQVLIYA